MLHHQRVSAEGVEPASWLVMLHGILGRGENWSGFARRLVAARPAWGCVLVDLRMHGASRDLPGPHTLAAATGDVVELIAALDGVRAVAGHSFGGKVALGLLVHSELELEDLFVLDASPAARTPRPETDMTARVLRALHGLPARMPDRQSFGAALAERGIARPIVLWLAKNLVRDADGLRLDLDLAAIDSLLADHDRHDLWPQVRGHRPEPHLHFITAGRSHVIDAPTRAALQELAAEGVLDCDELPGAGHWLHVDDPEGLLRRMLARLGAGLRGERADG